MTEPDDDTEAAEAIDALLGSRPRGLTPRRIDACLPRLEPNPEWEARRDAGELPDGVLRLAGSMRQVWPQERLSLEQARWILALREHLSWRALASWVAGDGNQITGMFLEEAAQRVVDEAAGEPQQAPRTYLVTRHAGARQWAEEEGIGVDELVSHLDVTCIRPGDTVIGSLPVNLAAQVCARGGRYLHLTLEVPPGLRGRELSAETMRDLGARVEAYDVVRSD